MACSINPYSLSSMLLSQNGIPDQSMFLARHLSPMMTSSIAHTTCQFRRKETLNWQAWTGACIISPRLIVKVPISKYFEKTWSNRTESTLPAQITAGRLSARRVFRILLVRYPTKKLMKRTDKFDEAHSNASDLQKRPSLSSISSQQTKTPSSRSPLLNQPTQSNPHIPTY